MTSTPTDIIPDDWRRWSLTAPELIRPLTSGLTNRSFLLGTGGEKVVLRWNSPISAELDIDRRAEEQALQLASHLSAPLVYCDPDYHYLVTRFIDGRAWNPDAKTSDSQLSELARLTRNIHQLPTIERHLDIRTKIAAYWQSLGVDQKLFQSLQRLDRETRTHIAAAEAMGDKRVLCHNDLQSENLISVRNGQLYAIDWEYAATGDPFYELAVIAEEHVLQGVALQIFLEEYLQRTVHADDLRRLDHWRVIYVYLCALWYAVRRPPRAKIESSQSAKLEALGQRLSSLLTRLK